MALSRILNKRNLLIAGVIFLICGLTACVILGSYVLNLSQAAKEKFGSKKWELPARIYARPLELYPGLKIEAEQFEKELELMQYRRVNRIDSPGSFSRLGNTFTLFTRPFLFEDGKESAKKIRAAINNQSLTSLTYVETGERASLARLDPAHIGSFYPTHNQDRLWVKFKDLSPLLIQTILAVEDRDFYKHFGVKPMAVLRAVIVNIKEGRFVQGGSTLTQQLVKNLFLSREQTIRRKAKEAIMAVSLEMSYEKDQIFEAYVNEVYMGQDGKRAIHGFGMASEFYFGRSLSDLRPGETALLVGLLKGPSYYDPRRYPEKALKRRNTILKVMQAHKLIRPDVSESAMKEGLEVIQEPPSGSTKFPAFMEFVKRNLLEEYKEEDLRSEGLLIFTTLSPQIQFALEKSISSKLTDIEIMKNLPPGELEAAAIVTSTSGNEVLALTGGRDTEIKGFNRALDARRSIGSLIKPAVYLTALQYPEQYTLISPMDDSELKIDNRKNIWRPKNYDRRYHGIVPLYQALVYSYNIPAVRLGMEIGLENVLDTVHKLGVDREFNPYPSALLGAIPMSVLDVAQMYQTFASGGFYSPVRAIQGVYKPDGSSLQRYPLTVRENIDPGAVYLLNKVLQTVVKEGTGAGLKRFLPENLGAAGKTGTTNDLRDSWFAGFTGNHLAVVWLGRDDNQPCDLTGASGALLVWGDVMSRILNTPLKLSQPGNIKWVVVDPDSGFKTESFCPGALSIPFIAGSEPLETVSCGQTNRPYQYYPETIPPDTEKESKPTIFDILKDTL